ncbi:cellobiose phosphorylase [Brachybacterium nesterenkovii]|uniref:cellobiose phosphorylase n=1 Tax=Brachybacterium nesterenkovii TaxID=47847 RepID=UPI0032195016
MSPAASVPRATAPRLPLVLERTGSGDIARLEADGLSLVQYPSTELESGPAGLWARVHGGSARRLTGPASGGVIDDAGVVTTSVDGVSARAACTLGSDGTVWAWSWELRNEGAAPVDVDVLAALDAALTPRADIERNEQYVAQYLDLTPLETPTETALAVRQNMPGARQPWTVLASDTPVAQWGTDARQLLDEIEGAGLDASRNLPSRRLQHEHTLAALRTERRTLAAGESWAGRVWGFVLADHPAASGPDDVVLVAEAASALAGTELQAPAADGAAGAPVAPSLLSAAPPVAVREASPAEREAFAPGADRLTESIGGHWASAFSDAGHVVSAAKERAVLRPHGQIQQVHAGPEADASAVTSTVWMRGVFASQLTVGHASAVPALSIRRSYVGLCEAAGVRLLTREADGSCRLLAVPSLWRAGREDAEWLYLADGWSLRVRALPRPGGTVVIEAEPAGDAPALLAVAFPGQVRPQVMAEAAGAVLPLGDDSALFADGVSRGVPAVTAQLPAGASARIIVGVPGADLSAAADVATASFVPRLPRLVLPADRPGAPATSGDAAAALAESLAWLARDASVHFRSPRGLEQYTGGAWGTRDVCQGPLGLLVATDEDAALRETLVRIFSAQQEGGDWPQWFDYLPEHAGPGLRDSHGDVVYWPLRALGEYLQITGDASILDEGATWIGAEAVGEVTPVRKHVERAVACLASRRTRDERLPAYDHGDWNDSLQPARPELARLMCSTWTTELEISSLRILTDGLDAAGATGLDELIARCRGIADRAEEALREVLLVDGELAGYAVIGEGQPELIVHPRDERMRHGSLQMIHAIGDELLEPEEAAAHLALIEEHLAGPTGVYLFDRPVPYRGGVMDRFQRAEAATFWGREIGLMYMHSHLRWIEALTHLGETERLWDALLHAIPAGLPERVPGGAPRQSNVYASSSDAAFADRAEAEERAADLFDASTRFEAGWRVYSSGPGLLLRIIVEDVLGIRRRGDMVEIDPVLPAALDGTEAEIPFDGGAVTVALRRGERGVGLRSLVIDGQAIDLSAATGLERRYREAGVRIPRELLRAGARVEVGVG